MRHIIFLLFMAFTLQAIAQYPATGNKMRLGWQTTGDGLVYRGAIGDTATLDPSGINNAWMLLDTANGNLYAYRAKAWRLVSGGGGSVSDTLTGEVKGPLDSTYIDTVANIIFRLDSTTVGVGEVKYNDTQGSIQQGLKGGNVTNVIGQQLHQRVSNKTGSPLAKGEAVYLQGSQGNRITVAKAIATVDSTSANTFGIVAENIADNQSGYIITEGLITGLNTSALTEGAAVWLSPTVAGGLTTTKPQAPDHGVYIGVCVKQNNGSGELFVKIRNGQELEELHDVRITSPATNASLYYNASEGIWRDTGAAVLVADTAAMLTNYINVADTATMLSSYISNADTSVFARDFQISGTADYIAKFTGTNRVGDANIKEVVGNTSSEYVLRLGTDSDGNFLAYLGNRLILGASNSDAYNYYANNPSFLQPNLAIVGASDQDTLISVGRKAGASVNKARFFVRNSTSEAIVLGVASDNATTFHVSQPNSGAGNVGIATSSPSRPLHVNANSSMIIPSGATGTRPAPGANGDLRYSTTFSNIEFYRTDRWIRPLVGTVANNKVAFASGDTLTSNTNFHWDNTNTRLGIGNAAPDSTLTVTGGIRATTGITAARFTATGSTVPTNGMYLPATNALAFSTNSTERMRILSDGKVGINVTPTEQLQVGGTVRATRFNVNTFSTQVVSINNFAPTGAGSLGGNLWIGSGGQSSSWTSGDDACCNLSIGSNALQANTRGAFNLAIGESALAQNTTGNGNIAIGRGAIAQSAQELNSIAIGAYSLQKNNNTTGENIAIGFGAMGASVNTRYNVAVGSNALSGTSGNENVAIGRNALLYGTSGGNNTAVGYSSLERITTGSNNVAIGWEAGKYFGASTTNLNETSSTSVYIGRDTRSSANGNSNEIVIGDQGRGNGSNTTTIGNSSTTATILQYGETRLGMAVDSGAYTLQVNGDTKLIGNLARKKPVTIAAATYTVLSDDSWLICNHTAQITITLPTAANSIGRELMIKYVAGGGATVISNATNVSPIVGGALTNIILPATAGSWVTLVCDGANWIIMQKG